MNVEKARISFNMHDHDKDGEINLVELVEILGELNLYFITGLDIMSRFGNKGRIKFDDFWKGASTLNKEKQEEEEEYDNDDDDGGRFRSGSIIYQGKVMELTDEDEY